MEKNPEVIQKMQKAQLRLQLNLRNIRCAASASKSRLLSLIYQTDGTAPPKIDDFTDDIPTLYYKSSDQLKEQMRLRKIPIGKFSKKKAIELIIKHDGHEVPIKKPPNPNKQMKVKVAKRPKTVKKARKTKNPKRSYSTYIYKVLKQVHPDTGISNKAMAVMNDFVFDIMKRIGEEARLLCEMFKRRTMTAREIQTSVRLCIRGELGKHAVSEGTKAVTKYSCSEGGGSQSARAGLQFPVGRIKTFLKAHHYCDRIGRAAPVYLAATLEYLVAEILELGGNAARDNKKNRVTPRHIQLAIRNDEELNKLLRDTVIASGGSLPNIHAVLIPRKSLTNGIEEEPQEY